MDNAKSNCRDVALSLFALPSFTLAASTVPLPALSLSAPSLFALTLCSFDHEGAGQPMLLQDISELECKQRQIMERPTCTTGEGGAN